MKIGVPKEIKNGEFRIAATPELVKLLTAGGHMVCVESGAGIGSGIEDAEFENAGATLGDTATAWDAELVLKVKEPVESEYQYLKEGMILFSYLHLAGSPRKLTETLLEKKVAGISMETVEKDGILNLAAPMSEVAGKMAVEMGAYYLQKHLGGKGVLIDSISGVNKSNVVVIGGGTAGLAAAEVACARGAAVTLFDTREDRRERAIKHLVQYKDFKALSPEQEKLEPVLLTADIVVGSALNPGARTPHVVKKETVAKMAKGTVLVDISIDQGGCFETSKAGTHDDPVHVENGIIHYAVPNMPGTFPRTSTFALVNATTPYITSLSHLGIQAAKEDDGLLKGVATYDGKLFSKAVGEYFKIEVSDF